MSGVARRGWRHPIFVDLTGQPVVVFGGGTVAERKIEILIQSGARVRVVSPELTDLVARWAETGRIDVERRGYQAGDLAGARLAYAATSDARVNEAIRDEARREGIWLNVVDQPGLCDFITPALVRRGDLTIAVSTNGRVPGLSKQIRQELEQRYGPGQSANLAETQKAEESSRSLESEIELLEQKIRRGKTEAQTRLGEQSRAVAEALIMRYKGRLAEHRCFIDAHGIDPPDITE